MLVMLAVWSSVAGPVRHPLLSLVSHAGGGVGERELSLLDLACTSSSWLWFGRWSRRLRKAWLKAAPYLSVHQQKKHGAGSN